MIYQAKNFFLLFIVIAMMITILFQSACKNDDDNFSHKDFANKIKGDWFVFEFWKMAYPIDPWKDICYVHINDSVGDYYDVHATMYSINDPTICGLPEIENMQYWTITESDDELSLKTTDLCGNIKSYKIDFSNFTYDEVDNRYYIFADVNLSNSDTTWQLRNFGFNEHAMSFSSHDDSLYIYEYDLRR